MTYFISLFGGRFGYARRGDHFVAEGGNRSAAGNFARFVTAHSVADDEKRRFASPEREAFETVLIDFSLHTDIGFTEKFHKIKPFLFCMKNKLWVYVFCFCAELTARRVDIAAEMTSHRCNDMIFCQSFGKAADVFSVGGGKAPARCVDGNKIYVQRHIGAVFFQDCRKGARVLFRIVFACRKRVFKGYSPSCFRKIIVTRRQKLLNAPVPVYRHER